MDDLNNINNDNNNEDNDDDVQLSSSSSPSSIQSQEQEQEQVLSQPQPQFKVKQKVYARDTDTPLLYEAIVRKLIYAPISKQVKLGHEKILAGDASKLLNSNNDTEEGDDDDDNHHEQEEQALNTMNSIHKEEYAFHYFVHYQGWNVKWDRWIQENHLYEDNENTRILATRLKEESKVLKRKKSSSESGSSGGGSSSDKVVMQVIQKMIRLEEEFKEMVKKGEDLSSFAKASSDNDNDNINKSDKNEKKEEPKVKTTEKEVTAATTATKSETKKNITETTKFIHNEVDLRLRDLSSKKTSNAINIPFTFKKVLTDEWEVISQCGMVHNLPATVSVMDALNAYYDGKVQMLRSGDITNSNTSDGFKEEKKEDKPAVIGEVNDDNNNHPSTNVTDGDTNITTNNENNPAEQEWKDMIIGLSMYFDQMLPKQLLYRHELPQCLIQESLNNNYNDDANDNVDNNSSSNIKRYCEIYPCEHLLRLLCLKLPELIEHANDVTEEEKSKIMFKIGDLVRFLQKHQDRFVLQRYRKPNVEESDKARRLQSRLGLNKNALNKEDKLVDNHVGGGDNGESKNNDKDGNNSDDEKKRKKGCDYNKVQRKKKKISQ